MAEITGSIIEYLGSYGTRIVSIEAVDDGFQFVEQCDCYFMETLSLEQFDKFIEELKEMRDFYVRSTNQ